MTREQLQNFFDTHPALNHSVLSKECGFSGAYLYQYLTGKLKKIRTEQVIPVLKKYGYEEK